MIHEEIALLLWLADNALDHVFALLEILGQTPNAMPLRAVETEFAVDSFGFSTSRFVRWFDQKYGTVRVEHEWVKCHLVCGVKTHVVTAVRILDKDAADAPQFAPMVKATDANFTVNEVSADKGYLSAENIEAVFQAGGTPYIAFKENTTGGKGGLFERMFHYYSLNKEEYMAHYHKRSNVESTFSMVKAKFRDHVRSKTDTAMKNEVLCKLLCHNICCLIMSQCELGIDPVFWPETPKAFGVHGQASTSKTVNAYLTRPQANGKTALEVVPIDYCPFCGNKINFMALPGFRWEKISVFWSPRE